MCETHHHQIHPPCSVTDSLHDCPSIEHQFPHHPGIRAAPLELVADCQSCLAGLLGFGTDDVQTMQYAPISLGDKDCLLQRTPARSFATQRHEHIIEEYRWVSIGQMISSPRAGR